MSLLIKTEHPLQQENLLKKLFVLLQNIQDFLIYKNSSLSSLVIGGKL